MIYFRFLELSVEHSECKLKRILIKIERSLKETSDMFTFIGSRYRVKNKGHKFSINTINFNFLSATTECLTGRFH